MKQLLVRSCASFLHKKKVAGLLCTSSLNGHPFSGEEVAVAPETGTAVAAPINEDLNDEEDEGAEENALVESAAAKKKVAKAATKQQKVTWLGKTEAGADGIAMYRYGVCMGLACSTRQDSSLGLASCSSCCMPRHCLLQ